MKKAPFKENPFVLYSTFKRQDNFQTFDIWIYGIEILSTFIYPILCKMESWDMTWIYIIWIFVYLGCVSVVLNTCNVK